MRPHMLTGKFGAIMGPGPTNRGLENGDICDLRDWSEVQAVLVRMTDLFAPEGVPDRVVGVTGRLVGVLDLLAAALACWA